MFNAGTSTLSLSKILLGLSKSIGIFKELSPIYKEIKPIIKKIPYLKEKLTRMKDFNTTRVNPIKTISEYNLNSENTSNNKISGPVFFQ